ncbi:MAG: family 10 glycosylhydrolase [Acidobacteria bacterium]|nr:family 10 glycosylhydrolase [Acidobacteriota bacterium]
MKRVSIIIFCYLLLFLSALLPTQQTAAPSQTLLLPLANMLANPSSTPGVRTETRALWVVRYTLSSPEAVKELVRRAKGNGFTDLVVQVRGRGDAYYASRLEPRAEVLANQPADFDPLALTIDEAHRVGLRVHAWINIYIVANIEILPRSGDHLIYKHPEWVGVPRGLAGELYYLDPESPDYLKRVADYTRANRNDLEGIFVSPAHPEVKENIFSIWMDVAQKYEVDGLHFDYVRYPNPQFDYSRTSLDRFRAEIEKNLNAGTREFLATQAGSDPLIYATTYPDRYAQFQRNQVTDLVAQIYRGVKRVKPHVVISAAVFANDEVAAKSRFQDWKLWLKRGWLDVVCPMAYTTDTDLFRKQLLSAINNSSGKQVWGGISAFKQTADSSLEKIKVTRDLGADGFILFSYDSSIKVSAHNPQGNYLERVREALRIGTRVMAQ